jgi:putative ABC transport system permease protein
MVSSLDIIVWVLIVSAGLLAIIVLYNLANININERVRELATIKVLGFYDKEVSAYIYRENNISTALGILLGLVLGTILEQFALVVVEADNMMFAPDLPYTVFLYSAVLTAVFAGFINLIIHFKLKKIDMVESMKSVE